MKNIYTKWIKEALENQYDIYPIGSVPNPKNQRLKVWIYKDTPVLRLALEQITMGKGDNSNGNKNTH